jgi:hypothetical protein
MTDRGEAVTTIVAVSLALSSKCIIDQLYYTVHLPKPNIIGPCFCVQPNLIGPSFCVQPNLIGPLFCVQPNLIGTRFCVQNRQVFCLYCINYQRFPTLRLYSKFSIYMISFFSGFGLDNFHCIYNTYERFQIKRLHSLDNTI